MIAYCDTCQTGNNEGSTECAACGSPLGKSDHAIGGRATPAGKQSKQSAPAKEVIVTTADLHEDYEIIGPVFFQTSNKGIFSNDLEKLTREYKKEIEEMLAGGRLGHSRSGADLWGLLIGEWSVGESKFDLAFFIAVQELKKRAKMLGADAIVGMRHDIDLDTTGFAFFYLQMYGTAVRIVR